MTAECKVSFCKFHINGTCSEARHVLHQATEGGLDPNQWDGYKTRVEDKCLPKCADKEALKSALNSR
jgi:hypothetical protein